MTQGLEPGALAGLRVLDLTGATGAFAAKLLAEFGAEVVKVEPPAGAPTRSYYPLLESEPVEGTDRPSLWFSYYHANQTSIVLDLERAEDCERLRQLAARFDVILEDFRPGYLAERGLDYVKLSAANPGLILASVTGFGQTGPHAGWRWTDLIAWSMGGMTYISGLPDREPLAGTGQAGHFGSFYAVLGVLIALAERAESGRGQHVDVSAQEAVAAHPETLLWPYTYCGDLPRRIGSEYTLVVPYKVLPCRDGYVLVVTVSQQQWDSLVQWMTADGQAADLSEEKWKDPLTRLANRDYVHGVIEHWIAGYTKGEAFRQAQARNIPFGIVSTTVDLATDEHLAARNSLPSHDWTGTGQPFRAPGPLIRPSEGRWQFRRPAPKLGEHTAEVLAELAAPAPVRGGADPNGPGSGGARAVGAGLPLAGIKVADFTWVGAGPLGTRVLADFGATVVKVEAIVGGDVLRGIPPFKDHVRGENRSGMFNCVNRNKLSLRLDLKQPEGIELAKRLVRWADVVPANFSSGTMERFGLGYETLRDINPDLIMVEMPGFGTFGPRRDYISYAPTLQAVSGVTCLTGYPDAGPTGIGNAFSDHVGGMTMALAILLGLTHRHRTGRGQWIEIAQLESSLALIGPAVLEYFANGRVRRPSANVPVEYPHGPAGVFRCAGDDRWVAIDVETQVDWQTFCKVIGRPDLVDHPDYARPEQRAQSAALAECVTAWTSQRDSWEAAELLQRAGLAAGPVSDAADLFDRDAHLRAREFWVTRDHGEMGPTPIERSPIRMSRTPGSIRTAAPLLGEHTEYVLGELLGLDQDAIDQLLIAGVV